MSDRSRSAVLERLRASRPSSGAPAGDFDVLARTVFPPSERYPRLRRAMEAVQAEFLETTQEQWPRAVAEFVRAQGFPNLIYGPGNEVGRRLAQDWPQAEGSPELVAYDRPIEEIKSRLFDGVAAGFTSTRGGIADSGGLIVWPSPEEPRLLSLVPPVHIALLDTEVIFDTFWDAMRAQRWAGRMPPNALLVSGPSKTADIEQTLAYGVHGPKRLVVVAIRREGLST